MKYQPSRACSDLCRVTRFPVRQPERDRSEQALFYGRRNMTKAEHKQRATDLAYQVRHCYSKTAKKEMVKECLRTLMKSRKGA